MINFIECARRAMKEAHRKEIIGLKDAIQKDQEQIIAFETADSENEKLTDTQFAEKYPDKIQRQKDKFGKD